MTSILLKMQVQEKHIYSLNNCYKKLIFKERIFNYIRSFLQKTL